jgi:hypothetical protein
LKFGLRFHTRRPRNEPIQVADSFFEWSTHVTEALNGRIRLDDGPQSPMHTPSADVPSAGPRGRAGESFPYAADYALILCCGVLHEDYALWLRDARDITVVHSDSSRGQSGYSTIENLSARAPVPLSSQISRGTCSLDCWPSQGDTSSSCQGQHQGAGPDERFVFSDGAACRLFQTASIMNGCTRGKCPPRRVPAADASSVRRSASSRQ